MRKEKLDAQQPQVEQEDSEAARIKLKWKAGKDDPDNGGYTSEYLTRIFSCYGRVSTLLISSKRKGSAIVEFEPSGVSSDILGETGHKDNPISMTWLSGKPSKQSPVSSDTLGGAGLLSSKANSSFAFGNVHASQSDGVNFNGFGPSLANSSGPAPGDGNDSGKDFESLVLMRMRQAEERKKLIEQMKKEDDEG